MNDATSPRLARGLRHNPSRQWTTLNDGENDHRGSYNARDRAGLKSSAERSARALKPYLNRCWHAREYPTLSYIEYAVLTVRQNANASFFVAQS